MGCSFVARGSVGCPWIDHVVSVGSPVECPWAARGVYVAYGVSVSRSWGLPGAPMSCQWVARGLSVRRAWVALGEPMDCPWGAHVSPMGRP